MNIAGAVLDDVPDVVPEAVVPDAVVPEVVVPLVVAALVNALVATYGLGHWSGMAFHWSGLSPLHCICTRPLDGIEPKAEADWHSWPNTGRLATVISTGAAARPPCRRRRRPPDFSDAGASAGEGDSGRVAICRRGKQCVFQEVASPSSLVKTKTCAAQPGVAHNRCKFHRHPRFGFRTRLK
jgi:hypothetical protein